MVDSRTSLASVEDFPPGIAVVIGGSGVIGSVICAELAKAGCDVALTYKTNRIEAERTGDAVRLAGRGAVLNPLDLTDASAVKAYLEEVAFTRGPIHTIVNAAGTTGAMCYVSQLTAEDWQSTIHTEVNGFFHLVQAAIPLLRAEGGGCLIALTSAALERWSSRNILSVAPKSSIETLIRGVAREEGRYQIRANCVAVGLLESGMHVGTDGKPLDELWLEAALRNIALHRVGKAREIANAVTFLASSKASYITGQSLIVDGGYSI